MKVAVIGGGINGVMTAWAFARRGDTVESAAGYDITCVMPVVE